MTREQQATVGVSFLLAGAIMLGVWAVSLWP